MSSSAIILIVIIVSALLLIRFAGKFILKLIGVLLFIPAILLGLYLFNLPPFNNNIFSRDNLNKKFCMNESSQDICDCIVKPYTKLIEDKFEKDELKEIESKNYESAYIFSKLSTQLAVETTLCTGSEDSTKKLTNKFIKEISPFGYTTAKTAEWFQTKTTEIDDKQLRKKELDEKLDK